MIWQQRNVMRILGIGMSKHKKAPTGATTPSKGNTKLLNLKITERSRNVNHRKGFYHEV